MKNENEKQSYYGYLDIRQGTVVLKEFKVANTESAIAYVKHLREIYKNKKIKLIQDGAGYHRAAEFQTYLEDLNKGVEQKDWLVERLVGRMCAFGTIWARTKHISL